jgi:hypothetical protein
MELEAKEDIYNLALDCKKESDLRIGSELYHVSKNFTKHQAVLFQAAQGRKDNALSTAKDIIDGYFDHVFIENSQEEKIEEFRSIVLDHCISHLGRSLEEEKGRGYTNCKILILTPFMGDARAIMDLLEERYPEY